VVCDETELALLALSPDMNCLEAEPVYPMVESSAAKVLSKYRIVRFHGRAMIELSHPYPHFEPLNKELLREVATPLLGWVKQRHMNHLYDYLISTVPDLSGNDRFVVFGDLNGSRADVSVWDMKRLEFRHDISPLDCVRRSPYSVKLNDATQRARSIPLIMQLAGGDTAIYDDIMQSLAPLVMACKPEGVVWWVAGDDIGKQLLMKTVRRILPRQLAELDVERLEGGRQMPKLNGKLGNVGRAGSGAVADVSLYRSLAKHQTFGVHKYRSQDGMSVPGNVHHIFSSPNAPIFSRKTWSTQMRSVVIPFSQLTNGSGLEMADELYGRLLAEICTYATRIRHQGYRYSLSVATTSIERDGSSSGESNPMISSSLFSLTGEFIW
jgi:hypothetical protein